MWKEHFCRKPASKGNFSKKKHNNQMSIESTDLSNIAMWKEHFCRKPAAKGNFSKQKHNNQMSIESADLTNKAMWKEHFCSKPASNGNFNKHKLSFQDIGQSRFATDTSNQISRNYKLKRLMYIAIKFRVSMFSKKGNF